MEPNDVCEFQWFEAKLDVLQNVFISQCQNFNYNICPCLVALICKILMTADDCIFHLHEPATMTNSFVTWIQEKLFCFNVPLPHSPHRRAQSALICVQTLFFPNIIVFHREKCKQAVYFEENWFEFTIARSCVFITQAEGTNHDKHQIPLVIKQSSQSDIS